MNILKVCALEEPLIYEISQGLLECLRALTRRTLLWGWGCQRGTGSMHMLEAIRFR